MDLTPEPTVRHSLSLLVIDPISDDPVRLDADLSYEPADPFAVTALFHTEGESVAWCFSRELLIDGCYEPAGEGDVHIWPDIAADGGAVVVIELCTDASHVLIQADARDVARFVKDTLVSVPLGDEARRISIEDELSQLLAC